VDAREITKGKKKKIHLRCKRQGTSLIGTSKWGGTILQVMEKTTMPDGSSKQKKGSEELSGRSRFDKATAGTFEEREKG